MKQLFAMKYGIVIGEEVARGGSGTFYTIDGDDNHVMKIMDVNENTRKIVGEKGNRYRKR